MKTNNTRLMRVHVNFYDGVKKLSEKRKVKGVQLTEELSQWLNKFKNLEIRF